ncbi:hypothetical protein PVAP13_6NG135603 [Panicum virgatum]|uniref:Uncharacterized protein n=1 Tax=Panicum virgatum TaxID=38727 RepID=A0A8T0R171_PANVG|nr:hypothetical protein PVAP13_6NG135603 [Panicum virgatum]
MDAVGADCRRGRQVGVPRSPPAASPSHPPAAPPSSVARWRSAPLPARTRSRLLPRVLVRRRSHGSAAEVAEEWRRRTLPQSRAPPPPPPHLRSILASFRPLLHRDSKIPQPPDRHHEVESSSGAGVGR